MKLLVVLPHSDPTLEPAVPSGWTLEDAAGAFAKRASSPEALLTRAGEEERAATPETLRRALLLRAAASLLLRSPGPAEALRAMGAAFTGLSTASVQLRLDDLELSEGRSTERGVDVLAASRGALPFSDELQKSVSLARSAEQVRLWIDRDQQLPAALAFAEALDRPEALALDGPFAHRHADALCRLSPALREVAHDPLPCTFALTSPEGRLRWRQESDRDLPEGKWAGHVTLSECLLLAPADGARALSVGLASVDEQTVLGADGSLHPLELVRTAFRRLADAGVQLSLEWWVGAPGESAEAHEKTLLQLDHGALAPARLVGLRPFHWSRHRALSRFGHREVRLEQPPTDRDLARSYPFVCADTLAHDARATLIEALATRALARHPLVPGRVALAYVTSAALPESAGGALRLARDCAIVSLPAALDAKPQQTWYAVQLGTRTTLAMDPRLAPQLAAWTSAQLPEAAMPKVPAAMRERLVTQLIQKRILEEAAP